MIAAPWYLLAAGTILVILGYIAGGLAGSPGASRPAIHHKMHDEDIINSLNQEESLSLSGLITFVGYLLVVISIVWRIARGFV